MFNEYLEVITGDGQKITLSSHFSENSKKSILINHGMAEHQRRYKEFINFLNLNGINVFIYDHRGHGNRITASEPIGVFAKQNGWNLVVNDLNDVSNFLVNKFSDHTFSVFGHSMGSYITLDSIQSGNPIKNIILSGSSVPGGSILMFQNLFLKLSNLLKGKENYSQTMHELVFGGFNKSIKNSRTSSDWLSYSASSVDDYIAEVEANYTNAASDEEKLNIIMTEYHLALFGNGVEAYNSYRRTGMPNDLQPLRAADVDNFLRSFFYPTTSVSNNSNSDQKDDVTAQVFWDTNPAGGFIK